MLVSFVVVLVMAVPSFAQQAQKSDTAELEALVMEYTRFEDAGDFQAQAKMIAPDRWFHNVNVGRRTENATYLKVQEEGFANSSRRYPGLKYYREVRDLKARLVAPTVGITSFTWFVNRLIPPDLPSDKVQALGLAPIPSVISLVWVRQQDGWKIINAHFAPLFTR
jgi:ketosteroid isomerase-like protein